MIYQDDLIRIEHEENELPWIKIFTAAPYKELSECDEKTRQRLFDVMLIAEKMMIEFYKPAKINIASFGNVLPLVHIHVIARFETDAYFPNSTWGERVRESSLNLPSFDEFINRLVKAL